MILRWTEKKLTTNFEKIVVGLLCEMPLRVRQYSQIRTPRRSGVNDSIVKRPLLNFNFEKM